MTPKYTVTPEPQATHLTASDSRIPARALHDALASYALRWPEEAEVARSFAAFLDEAPTVFERIHLEGHFTASSWLVDGSGTRVLLTHHRKLDRWLQLGGHADGVRDFARVALTEAEEESGLTDLIVEAEIFDLDAHEIPEHKGVPAHIHYDVRFVVHAGANEDFVVSDESHALAWRAIVSLVEDEHADPSLRRMAEKWLAR